MNACFYPISAEGVAAEGRSRLRFMSNPEPPLYHKYLPANGPPPGFVRGYRALLRASSSLSASFITLQANERNIVKGLLTEAFSVMNKSISPISDSIAQSRG